jgi:hypothetical protein
MLGKQLLWPAGHWKHYESAKPRDSEPGVRYMRDAGTHAHVHALS